MVEIQFININEDLRVSTFGKIMHVYSPKDKKIQVCVEGDFLHVPLFFCNVYDIPDLTAKMALDVYLKNKGASGDVCIRIFINQETDMVGIIGFSNG